MILSVKLQDNATIAIRDFHNVFIDEVKTSFYNAAEKSIIIIKFDVDNNTVVILYKKYKNHDTNQTLISYTCNNVTKTVYLSFD